MQYFIIHPIFHNLVAFFIFLFYPNHNHHLLRQNLFLKKVVSFFLNVWIWIFFNLWKWLLQPSISCTFCPNFWNIFISCTFARVENALLWTTTLCGFTNPTTSILKLFKNRIVGMHSTTSSIHEMSSILAQLF